MKSQTIMGTLAIIFMALSTGSCTSSKPKSTANEFEPLPGGGSDWTAGIDAQAKSFVSPPSKIPAFSRFLLGFAEREFDKELLPGRVLTWSMDLGIASGVLEMYIEKGSAKILEPRMIYILRMQVSYAASCSFAIDVNSWMYKDHTITEEEIRSMQGNIPMRDVSTFTERERAALGYALAMSATPVRFDEKLLSDVQRLFSHEEIIAIAALVDGSGTGLFGYTPDHGDRDQDPWFCYTESSSGVVQQPAWIGDQRNLQVYAQSNIRGNDFVHIGLCIDGYSNVDAWF